MSGNIKGLNTRGGLPFLAEKAGKRPLRIAYLGASNTALETGWRPVIQNWFNERVEPRGKHVEINASIGGTDSLAGAFTCANVKYA